MNLVRYTLKTSLIKYLIETRGKISEYGTMERKLKDLLDTEHRLQEEIKELKNHRDRKTLENQSVLEREKEMYRTKLGELETRLKESESKRSLQIFEHEKERAKWTLEKDKILQEYEQVESNYRKVKAKKEKIEREYAKIKNDYRDHRKFIMSGAMNSSAAAKELVSDKVKLTKTGSNTDSVNESKTSTRTFRQQKYTKNYIGDYSRPKNGS